MTYQSTNEQQATTGRAKVRLNPVHSETLQQGEHVYCIQTANATYVPRFHTAQRVMPAFSATSLSIPHSNNGTILCPCHVAFKPLTLQRSPFEIC
jgi:hypothetical protein